MERRDFLKAGAMLGLGGAASGLPGVVFAQGQRDQGGRKGYGNLLILIELKGGNDGLKDRKSTRLNSSHIQKSRMPSSA